MSACTQMDESGQWLGTSTSWTDSGSLDRFRQLDRIRGGPIQEIAVRQHNAHRCRSQEMPEDIQVVQRRVPHGLSRLAGDVANVHLEGPGLCDCRGDLFN